MLCWIDSLGLKKLYLANRNSNLMHRLMSHKSDVTILLFLCIYKEECNAAAMIFAMN